MNDTLTAPRTPQGLLRVVAAAIVRDNRVLVAKRGDAMLLPGQWEFPGGKVELGESDEVALIREIMEELGAAITPQYLVDSVEHVYPNVSIHLLLYVSVLVGGEPKVTEHEALRWVTREDLCGLVMAPADEQLRVSLVERGPWLG
jgi:8-oxo-dGTP diphosphatase